MTPICDDLRNEHEALDAAVAVLDEDSWNLPTPADGWSVRDQVSHIAFFDRRALLAIDDPDEFAADARALASAGGTEASVQLGRGMTGPELLDAWRADRAVLLQRARTLDPSARVPWYGPAMSARSFLTARLMETWAHGQDVVDALGVPREATSRLRHVAHIGVRARPFSFRINGLTIPDSDVRVALRAPDGSTWAWGSDPDERVEGDALDFCLVVTQRRHLLDTGLVVTGPVATQWMSIAQAFAGLPGTGRAPSAR
jgi:uncharacterized protein (TIGR03084 family)